MKDGRKLLVSSAVASLVAPLLFVGLVNWSTGFSRPWVIVEFVLAWVVTVFHLLLLGLPMLVFMHHSGRLSWLTVLGSGFAAGFLPVGVVTFPLLSVGEVGLGGWFDWVRMACPFGLLGCVTAIVLRSTLLTLDRRFSN